MTGPSVRAIVRRNAAASSPSEVSGIGAATTFNPLPCNLRITGSQLDPSAHAPWITTTVAFFKSDIILHLFGLLSEMARYLMGRESGEKADNLLRNKLAMIFERKVTRV